MSTVLSIYSSFQYYQRTFISGLSIISELLITAVDVLPRASSLIITRDSSCHWRNHLARMPWRTLTMSSSRRWTKNPI